MEIHMNIYMDNCCFNRLLDNRKLFQIYYECNSVEIILEFANNAKRLPSSVRIANPTEFLMEVFYGKDS